MSDLGTLLAAAIHRAVAEHDANRTGDANREYYFTSATQEGRAERVMCLAGAAAVGGRSVVDVVSAARKMPVDAFAAWLTGEVAS